MASESAKEEGTMRDTLKEIRQQSVARDSEREFQLGSNHQCFDSNGNNNGNNSNNDNSSTSNVIVIVTTRGGRDGWRARAPNKR